MFTLQQYICIRTASLARVPRTIFVAIISLLHSVLLVVRLIPFVPAPALSPVLQAHVFEIFVQAVAGAVLRLFMHSLRGEGERREERPVKVDCVLFGVVPGVSEKLILLFMNKKCEHTQTHITPKYRVIDS